MFPSLLDKADLFIFFQNFTTIILQIINKCEQNHSYCKTSSHLCSGVWILFEEVFVTEIIPQPLTDAELAMVPVVSIHNIHVLILEVSISSANQIISPHSSQPRQTVRHWTQGQSSLPAPCRPWSGGSCTWSASDGRSGYSGLRPEVTQSSRALHCRQSLALGWSHYPDDTL